VAWRIACSARGPTRHTPCVTLRVAGRAFSERAEVPAGLDGSVCDDPPLLSLDVAIASARLEAVRSAERFLGEPGVSKVRSRPASRRRATRPLGQRQRKEVAALASHDRRRHAAPT
jgi:hypothetical protein